MSATVTHEKLRGMIADLDGYIERRATEIAGDRIKAAENTASGQVARIMAQRNEMVAERRADLQRQTGLVTELRRRILATDRQADHVETLRRRLAGAVGRDPALSPLPGLIAEVEDRLNGDPVVLGASERRQVECARDDIARWRTAEHVALSTEGVLVVDVVHLLQIVDRLASLDGSRG